MPQKLTVGSANQGAARKAKKKLPITMASINSPTWEGLNPNQKIEATRAATLEVLKILNYPTEEV